MKKQEMGEGADRSLEELADRNSIQWVQDPKTGKMVREDTLPPKTAKLTTYLTSKR